MAGPRPLWKWPREQLDVNQLSTAELSLVRGMVDELIVNRGILDLKNLKISEVHLDIRNLAKLAFQYYRMMLEGNLAFDFSDFEGNLSLSAKGFSDTCNQPRCLACGSHEDITMTPESTFIPLCRTCHQKLDSDIKTMSSIIAE
jgi:hypothetical protein